MRYLLVLSESSSLLPSLEEIVVLVVSFHIIVVSFHISIHEKAHELKLIMSH